MIEIQGPGPDHPYFHIAGDGWKRNLIDGNVFQFWHDGQWRTGTVKRYDRQGNEGANHVAFITRYEGQTHRVDLQPGMKIKVS